MIMHTNALKAAFKPYQDKIVDEVANKKEVSEDVANDVKSFSGWKWKA